MRKLLLFIFLIPALAFAQISIKGHKVVVAIQPTPPSSYSYTLGSTQSVSIGIYNNSGIKVRDIQSNVVQSAGVYPLSWDGNNDIGTPQSNGNYTAKILTNNVAYAWEGASIGNTSDSLTGATVHHNFNGIWDNAVIISGTAYVCAGYSEQFPCISAFTTAHPQQKIDLTDRHRTNKWTDWVCSNGTILYWGGRDAFVADSASSWVSGTLVSNGNDVTFSAGQIISTNVTPESGISYVTVSNAEITGMATQQGSGYLYVARGGLNNLYCVNNQTGVAVRTISLTNVRNLFIDLNGKLWLIHGSNTIEQYTINSDGTLTTTGITNTTITTPGGLSVSPDGTKLAVCSYDTQQVLFFTPSTGTLLSTLGLSGGYSSTPTVANNRFCWVTANNIGDGSAGKLLTYITFDPADNSYWVGDLGDYRAQHFSSSNTFIESVQYLPATYSTCVDLGNTARVFGGWLEFSVDYTATLSGSTGWTFVNNWSANVSQNYNQQDKFNFVHTFTSGATSRTFGFLSNMSTNNFDIVELPATGQLRFTGNSRTSPIIDEQGNAISNGTTVNRFAFTGFDGSNNPVWSGTAELLANVSSITPNDPVHFIPVLQNPITSGNLVMFYESEPYRNQSLSQYVTGAHLGAITKGGSSWNWLSQYATNKAYFGDFPTVQYFDIGNQVNFSAGTKVTILDHNIITGYNGEFWKASETNYFNHFWDDGLAIGQFGVNGPDADIIQSPYGMAGNALTPQVFRGSTSDVAWLVHGDESRHSGVHLWKITGLNSVSEQSIAITYPNTLLIPPTLPGLNLMSGLPFQTPVPNAANGWTRDAEVTINNQSAWFNVATGVNSWMPAFPDVNMHYRFTAASTVKTVVRDLANSATLTSWILTGILNYAGNFPNDGSGQGGDYMEILDVSGKILTRFYISGSGSNNSANGNDKVLFTMPFQQAGLITNHDQNITISAVGGVITFKYGAYTQSTSTLVDPTGNWAKPSSLRFYFFTSVANPGTNVDRIVNYRMGRFVATP